jgi:hypothetical protein
MTWRSSTLTQLHPNTGISPGETSREHQHPHRSGNVRRWHIGGEDLGRTHDPCLVVRLFLILIRVHHSLVYAEVLYTENSSWRRKMALC